MKGNKKKRSIGTRNSNRSSSGASCASGSYSQQSAAQQQQQKEDCFKGRKYEWKKGHCTKS